MLQQYFLTGFKWSHLAQNSDIAKNDTYFWSNLIFSLFPINFYLKRSILLILLINKRKSEYCHYKADKNFGKNFSQRFIKKFFQECMLQIYENSHTKFLSGFSLRYLSYNFFCWDILRLIVKICSAVSVLHSFFRKFF